MSEHDDEREAGRRYRELPREEPPPALDAKIRAEARRAVVTHPAPLVAPTGRRSWYFPVAAAAVIVLAVAVTWQIERSQPDLEVAMVAPPAPAAERPLMKENAEEKAKQEPEKPVQEKAPMARSKETRQAPKREFAQDPAAKTDAAAAAKPADEARDRASADSMSGAMSESRQDALGQRENRAR